MWESFYCTSQLWYHPSDFTHPCYKTVILGLINVAVIVGSTLVKLPQILKVIRAKSVIGLNETAFVIEVYASSFFVLYNFLEGHPFQAWGEVFFILIQCLILVFLFWLYTAENYSLITRIVYSSAWLFILAYTLSGSHCPKYVVFSMGLAPVPCTVVGRTPQIIQNYRQRHSGHLSLTTISLSLVGNCVRVLTTLTMMDDVIPVMANLASIGTNGTLFLQILWYRNRTREILTKSKRS